MPRFTNLTIAILVLSSVWLTACGHQDSVSEPDSEVSKVENTINLKGQPVRRVESVGAWTVFDNPYADGTANPAQTIEGTIRAYQIADRTTLITLSVNGLPPDRDFG